MKNPFKLSLILGIVLSGFTNTALLATPTVKNAAKPAPLSFIENKGQITDQYHKPRPDIDFRLAAADGLNIFIGDGAIHYQFSKCDNPAKQGFDPNSKFRIPNSATYTMDRMDVELIGANKHATAVTTQKQNYYENYFTDWSVEKGLTAHAYNRITYKDIYPNIDWVLYTSNGQLKHEFVVRAGGKVSDIKLKYGGAKILRINNNGGLEATTTQGTIIEDAPDTYQKDGKKVASSFRLNGDVLSYEVNTYVGEIIIDPSLLWATYYGGSASDQFLDITLDGSGNACMTGYATSTSGIATSGAYQTVYGGGTFDAIIVKFSNTGTIQWATYYGGTTADAGHSIATDPAGNILVSGQTQSSSGIATAGAHQAIIGGGNDAFLVKFSKDGFLIWGTYYGGSGADDGTSVTTDGVGNIFMGGTTASTSDIATPGTFQTAFGGGANDAFVVKFSSSGVRQWATYFGSSGVENGEGVAVDASGNVFLGGFAIASSGLASSGAYQTISGGAIDCVLAKFDNTGNRLWATYYGGTGDDAIYDVCAGISGNVSFAGHSNSSGFASSGAYQTTLAGTYDMLLGSFDGAGSREWATYYGGVGAETANGISVDAAGNVFIAGNTASTTGIATGDGYQLAFGGINDACLAKFNTSGTTLIYGTYLGGSLTDIGAGIAVDGSGNTYLAGYTSSTSAIATPGAYQTTHAGGWEGMLAKLNLCTPPVVAPVTGPMFVCPGNTITLTDVTAGGTWVSESPGIATISGAGVVTGVSAGHVLISYAVTSGGCTGYAKALVTVGNTIVTTILGTGVVGYTGDGGPATAAQIRQPRSVAVDGVGNVYVPHHLVNHIVRMINTSGVVNRVAGTGATGAGADGISATASNMTTPYNVAVDGAGNLYISEFGNNRVRKVDRSTGIITTVAGTGTAGFLGDGGPATAARMTNPGGLAFDPAGNLYICDVANNRVRKVSTDGIITTIAGNGTTTYGGEGVVATATGMSQPNYVCISPTGEVIISVTVHHRIRSVNAAGLMTTIAGTGTAGYTGDNVAATTSRINSPGGIAFDRAGNLYIADVSNQRIRMVNTSGIITTYAGTGTSGYTGDNGIAQLATFSNPSDISFDAQGDMYIADFVNSAIRKISTAAPPTLSPVSGPSVFCAGTPTLFTTASTGGYWSSSNTSVASVGSYSGYVTGVGAGTADISYSVVGTCATSSVSRSVTINAFSAGTISGPNIVCIGNTITLTNSGGGGTWSSLDPSIATVTSGGVVTGIAAGATAISYTITNGCGTTAATAWITVGTPIISTIAGGGASTGDGGPATAGQFGLPTHVFRDVASGDIYVPDFNNDRVRKIDAAGIITTIVGNGTATSTGNGGPATAATTNAPAGVYRDATTGNIYIAEQGGSRVRMINSSGIITNIVGTGSFTSNGDGGPASAATVNRPVGLTMDAAGNLYIAEWGGGFIRKIDPSGIITRFAGGGGSVADDVPATAAFMNTPYHIMFDGVGSLYVATQNGHRVRRIDLATGLIYTVAGNGVSGFSGDGGPATAAQLNQANGVYVDPYSIFITDAANNRLRKVDRSTGIITTIAGIGTPTFSGDGGSPATAGIRTPSSVVLDNTGNIYIADATNARIRKISMINLSVAPISGTATICEGTSVLFTNTTPGGAWTSSNPSVASVGSTTGLVTGALAGTATITYTVPNTCNVFTVYPVTVNLYSSSQITGPTMVCAGNTITLTNATPGGTWSSSDAAIGTVDAMGIVTGVAIGNVTISYTFTTSCGTFSARHQVVVGTPNITTIAGSGVSGYSGDGAAATLARLQRPNGIASDASGNVYITDYSNNVIRKINPSGVITTIVGTSSLGFSGDGGPATAATVSSPFDVALDATGNIYFTDELNHRIRMVNTSGIITTIAGSSTSGFFGDGGPATAARLSRPTGLAFDATGNLYFSDFSNHRIRRITPAGIISTVMGTGITSFNGDGLPATATNIGSPNFITFDQAGNLLVSDVSNVRIRMINSFGVVSTIAGNSFTGSSGDGGPATAANLNLSAGIAVDGAGNIYISDNGNNRIRVVNSQGIINAYSGTGTAGYFGDNGPPTAARFRNPSDIAFDDDGNMLIADYNNHVVRKIAPIGSVLAPISGSSTVCLGSSITLTNTTSGGTWSSSNTSIATVTGGGVVSGAATGVVDISYSVISGCGIQSVVQSATVNPVPVTPAAITGTAFICVGSTATLSNTTPGGVWTSTATGIATVGSTTGIVTGVAAGTATISYTISNSCGAAAATTVATVNAASGSVSGSSNVCFGLTTTLTGSPSGGTWSSSDAAVAAIGSASGIVTGTTTGIATITYTYSGGCTSTMPVTVNPLPGPITGSSTVCAGENTTLSSAGGSTWSSSNSAVATIGSSSGIVTAVTPGTTTITSTSAAGCTATLVLTVNPAPAAITPSGAVTICEGATTTLSNPTPGGTWSSSSVANATVGTAGLVTGISAGAVTISYTHSSGCSSTKTITIETTPSAITPSGATVCTGTTVTLSNSVSGGIWSSGAPGVASVSGGGVVTGVSLGTANISYSIGSCFTTAMITVNPSPVAGVIVGPPDVCIGTPVTYSNGTPGGIWSTSNIAIATVGTSGLVTGVSSGAVTISYSVTNSCGTVSATLPITVSSIASAGTIIGLGAMCAGTYTTLVNSTPGGIWSVTNSNASITGAGILTGITPGVDTVLYTVTTACGTAIDSHIVTIGAYLGAGTISGPSSVCVGSSITLTDPVPGGTWSSSTSAATVIGGVVTGISGGTTTISYTITASCGSASATRLVNVIPTPDGGILTGPTILCAGMTSTYTTTATGGTWGVTNSTATITSGGFVTAITTGIDTITYTVTNACGTDVSSTTVTIGPAITAGSISGPGFVCEGAAITLTNPVSGGVWSASNANATVSSGGVVTGVSAGSVNISYTVTSSCGSVSAVAYLAVLPAANAGTIAGPSTVCIGSTISLTNSTPGGIWSTSNSNATVSGGVVTGISAGTVNISYTVTTPCGSASAVHTVTVSTTPVAGTITGLTSVCAGASITLSATAPGGIWSADNANATISSSGLVTGVTAGTDMISYTVTTACGTATATSLITINPLPFAGAISGPADVCIGATITLTDPVTGGVWSASNTNATVSGGIVTGISAGIVNISYSVTNVCGTADAVSTITVHPAPDAGVITGILSICVGATTTLTDAVSGGVWSASNANATVAGGIVTGVTTGIDTISYTVTNICGTAVASVVVTINPVPAVTSISGPSSVCRGATITLTNATPGGVWSASNTKATISSTGVVTGVTTGADTIIYTVTNSCGSTSVTKTITISQPPVAGTIAGPSAVCSGQTITLSGGVLGGTWSSSNPGVAAVSPAGVVSGISAGSATISYTVTNGCGSRSATKTVSVLSIADCSHTNINGTAINRHNLKIYPNPNNGIFVLSGTIDVTTDTEVPMEIMDLLGRKIYSGNLTPDNGAVNERFELKDSIASGVYLLTIHTSAGKIIFNIVVAQ